MTILISKMINDEAKFSFTDTADLAEFIALSKAGSYDLFILVFNNVRWNGAGSRNDKVIEVIERIRSRGNAGLIALSCWWKEAEFPDKARRAGGDFFFALPFQTPDFLQPVRKCLSLDPAQRQGVPC
jgi:hypothetical protein